MSRASVQSSPWVLSDSLRPHGLQHARVPVHHQLWELPQIPIHQGGDAIQPSHSLLSLSPQGFNLSQQQGLFQWFSSSHQVAKVGTQMLTFKPMFPLSSLTFSKRLFSSFFAFYHKCGIISISEVIDVSPGSVDSSCASSSMAFCMIYSAYKLNKQGDNMQPWHTSVPIWNQSGFQCPVLTVASWPEYRFLRRQIRLIGQ